MLYSLIKFAIRFFRTTNRMNKRKRDEYLQLDVVYCDILNAEIDEI